jgi:transposase
MKNRVRQGNPERERQWQETVRRWRQSGQTVREYCRAQGLKESALYFWRRELTRRRERRNGEGRAASGTPKDETVMPARLRGPAAVRASGEKPAHFLPVRLVGSAVEPNGGALEIALTDGRIIRIRPGFDRQTLAAVLSVLESRPC